MRFDLLTIFPRLLESPLQEGILRRAAAAGRIDVHIHDIRSFATDKHAMTDDRPFGGGEGMVMKPEPIAAALEEVARQQAGGHVVLLSPQGRRYEQRVAMELAQCRHLVLLCGRYEGVDERICRLYDIDEISIGDYILTGGELGAMVVIDSVTRLLPGVLGCEDSAQCDTFSRGLLKHPQYTRPREFAGLAVPSPLLSGDHQAIARWRLIASVERTLERRPELLATVRFTDDEAKTLRREGLWQDIMRLRKAHAADENGQ